MSNTLSNQRDHLGLELINKNIPRGQIRFAIFDFDGTISLIREGWQDIMIPMMVNILLETPNHENHDVIQQIVRKYVTDMTGKQTIYQMIRLAEEVEKRGGKSEEPLEYKAHYHELLMNRIRERLRGLREKQIKPNEMAVPGSISALKKITQAGITCFLASGTDENYVLDEACLLEITPFFQGIYGARDDYKNFSKRMIIQKIIQDNNLQGPELVSFGDGFVEIEDTKSVGGIAIGLATDESGQTGIDLWKRDRLIASGADVIMPDFNQFADLWQYLMPEE